MKVKLQPWCVSQVRLNWPVLTLMAVVGLILSGLGSSAVLAETEAIETGEVQTAQVFESGPQRVTVLELYSSQGCNNCPPAERWMSELKHDDKLWQQVVPLVFHVDYWDALGWQDPYAALRHSQRQRMYQVHGYSAAVYTPGFILAGEEWTGWFQSQELPSLSQPEVGQLKVEVADGKAVATFVRSQSSRGLVLNVAMLGFDIVTEVKQGKNKGLALRQDFVVLNHKAFPSDSGEWSVEMPTTDFQGRTAAAFWVSQNSDPTPLQATGGWYQPSARQ
jgi:hypothetical protein